MKFELKNTDGSTPYITCDGVKLSPVEIVNKLNGLNDEVSRLNCMLKRKDHKIKKLANFNVELMNKTGEIK